MRAAGVVGCAFVGSILAWVLGPLVGVTLTLWWTIPAALAGSALGVALVHALAIHVR